MNNWLIFLIAGVVFGIVIVIIMKTMKNHRSNRLPCNEIIRLVCAKCGYRAKSKIDPLFGVGEMCRNCVMEMKTDEPTDKTISDRFSPGEREKIDRDGILAFKTVCTHYLSNVNHCKYCTKNDPSAHGCTAGYRYVYTV